MATVRDICERALRRIRVASSVDPVSAEDAAIARDVLNSMIGSWPAQGVQPFYTDLGLSATFSFFVPTETAPGEVIDVLAYGGTWNAATNTPSLASAVGTVGNFYKVSVSGSTVLDDVTSWTAGEYAMFSGVEWLKSTNSDRLNHAVINMLALELCDEFGKEPTATLARGARMGWSQIQAAFIRAPTAIVDRAIMDTFIRTVNDGALIDSRVDTDVYLVDD